MRGSQSESGGANGERSGPPWRSRPGLRKQSRGNWHSWRSAQGPMGRKVTSMSSAGSRRRSWQTRSGSAHARRRTQLWRCFGPREEKDGTGTVAWPPGTLLPWCNAWLMRRPSKRSMASGSKCRLQPSSPREARRTRRRSMPSWGTSRMPSKRPAPFAESWASSLCGTWMPTLLGRCVERWGNSSPPRPSSRTALQLSWTSPLRPSTTPKPTFGRGQFAMNGSACRSPLSKTWTPSTPSSGHSLGATMPWWRSRWIGAAPTRSGGVLWSQMRPLLSAAIASWAMQMLPEKWSRSGKAG